MQLNRYNTLCWKQQYAKECKTSFLPGHLTHAQSLEDCRRGLRWGPCWGQRCGHRRHLPSQSPRTLLCQRVADWGASDLPAAQLPAALPTSRPLWSGFCGCGPRQSPHLQFTILHEDHVAAEAGRHWLRDCLMEESQSLQPQSNQLLISIRRSRQIPCTEKNVHPCVTSRLPLKIWVTPTQVKWIRTYCSQHQGFDSEERISRIGRDQSLQQGKRVRPNFGGCQDLQLQVVILYVRWLVTQPQTWKKRVEFNTPVFPECTSNGQYHITISLSLRNSTVCPSPILPVAQIDVTSCRFAPEREATGQSVSVKSRGARSPISGRNDALLIYRTSPDCRLGN